MKAKFTIPALLMLLVVSACSKQPYYFSHAPVTMQAKATPTAQEATLIAEEMLPAVAVTTATAEEPVLTASVAATPARKATLAKAPVAVVTETAATPAAATALTKAEKKEVRQALKEVRKEAKQTPQDGVTTGRKSQLAAMLLAFFLGSFGVHRFYLGYTGIGLAQLGLTIIGLILIFPLIASGIWALVDFIRIITGDLKPKNEEYGSTL